jgi:hypothetical protein
MGRTRTVSLYSYLSRVVRNRALGQTSPNDFVICTGGVALVVSMVALVPDSFLTKILVTDSFATVEIAALTIAWNSTVEPHKLLGAPQLLMLLS